MPQTTYIMHAHLSSPQKEILFSDITGTETSSKSDSLEMTDSNPTTSTQKMLFLPQPFPDKNLESTSGFMSLDEIQQKLITSDTESGEQMRLFISKKFCHIIYSFIVARKKYSTFAEQYNYAIKLAFSDISKKNDSYFKEVYKGIIRHIMPLNQHLCVYVWGNATLENFSFQELSERLEVSCESFSEETIRISHFIELHIAGICRKILGSDVIAKIHLVNPEGFRNMRKGFSEVASKEQTKQRHADLLLELKNLWDKYIDIKSFLVFSAEYNRFSLFHPTVPLLQRYIAEMPNVIKAFIKENNIASGHAIYDFYDKLKTLRDSPLQDNSLEGLTNKFRQMLNIFKKGLIEPDLQKLKLSFGVNTYEDHDFIEFYENVLGPKLSKMEISKDIIKKIMVSGSKIDRAEHKATITSFINEILPDEMKEEALDFLENVILPRIKS